MYLNSSELAEFLKAKTNECIDWSTTSQFDPLIAKLVHESSDTLELLVIHVVEHICPPAFDGSVDPQCIILLIVHANSRFSR